MPDRWSEEPSSLSHKQRQEKISMLEETKVILLVEDTEDDIELTLLALERSKIGNAVVVARDGAEALAYLFGTEGAVAQPPGTLPQVVLLDLQLPRVGGLEVLARMRAEERTHW